MLYAAFVLGLVFAAPTPSDVQMLSWMSGRWVGSQDGTETEEFWTDVRGGSLLGMHRDTKGGKTVGFGNGTDGHGDSSAIRSVAPACGAFRNRRSRDVVATSISGLVLIGRRGGPPLIPRAER